MSFRLPRVPLLFSSTMLLFCCGGTLFAQQWQPAPYIPKAPYAPYNQQPQGAYPIPTHHTRTNTTMRATEVAPHDPPAPSLYATPYDRLPVAKKACGLCAGCQAGKGCIAHPGMAGPCRAAASDDPLTADGKGTSDCNKPCEEHLDLYGYPLQYIYGKEEPKKRYFRPYEFYPGTLGRQGWAFTFGYADASQNYRFYKPAAYISHEYVAAINRAVWEQLDAERAKEAYDAIQKEMPLLENDLEIAAAKLKEWQDYVDLLRVQHGFLPGDNVDFCPQCVGLAPQPCCKEKLVNGVHVVCRCHACCPFCCEIRNALAWLDAAKMTYEQAKSDLETCRWLVGERKEYMEFAVERARNSRKTANMSAFHQRVLVKPPLKRADPAKQEGEAAKEEYNPSG